MDDFGLGDLIEGAVDVVDALTDDRDHRRRRRRRWLLLILLVVCGITAVLLYLHHSA